MKITSFGIRFYLILGFLFIFVSCTKQKIDLASGKFTNLKYQFNSDISQNSVKSTNSKLANTIDFTYKTNDRITESLIIKVSFYSEKYKASDLFQDFKEEIVFAAGNKSFTYSVILKDKLPISEITPVKFKILNDMTNFSPSEISILLSPTPPPAPLVAVPLNGSYVNKSTYQNFSVSGNCESSGTVFFSVRKQDNVLLPINSVNCVGGSNGSNGTFSTTLDLSVIPDGSISLEVYQTVLSGVSSASTQVALIKDIIPPEIILTSVPTGKTNLVSLGVTVSPKPDLGKNDDLEKYQYKVGKSLEIECDENIGSLFSVGGNKYSSSKLVGDQIVDNITSIVDGEIKLCVLGIDKAGNIQNFSDAKEMTWVKDTQPPIVNLSSLPSNPTSALKLDVIVSDRDGASSLDNEITYYKYKFGVKANIDCSSTTGYSNYNLVTSRITDTIAGNGSYRLCVIGKDIAGNLQNTTEATVYEFDKNSSEPSIRFDQVINPRDDEINLTVISNGSPDAVSYQYAILSGSSCANAIYSADILIATKIIANISASADGDYILCAKGKSASDVQQSSPIYLTWTRDRTPPSASSFVVDIANNSSDGIKYTKTNLVNLNLQLDLADKVSKINFYNNSNCNGTPSLVTVLSNGQITISNYNLGASAGLVKISAKFEDENTNISNCVYSSADNDVIYDNNSPNLVINKVGDITYVPGDSYFINKTNYNSYSIIGSCEYGAEKVKIKDIDADTIFEILCMETNTFTFNADLSAIPDFIFKLANVSQKDKAGNETTIGLSIIKDTVQPLPGEFIVTPLISSVNNLKKLSHEVIAKNIENNIKSYKYKIGNSSDVNCNSIDAYSTSKVASQLRFSLFETVIGDKIEDVIESLMDGDIKLCILATDFAGNEMDIANAKEVVWKKDTQAPDSTIFLASVPLSFKDFEVGETVSYAAPAFKLKQAGLDISYINSYIKLYSLSTCSDSSLRAQSERISDVFDAAADIEFSQSASFLSDGSEDGLKIYYARIYDEAQNFSNCVPLDLKYFFSNKKIYIGGEFDKYDLGASEKSFKNILSLNPDGSLNSNFALVSGDGFSDGSDSRVRKIKKSGSDLYVSGKFNKYTKDSTDLLSNYFITLGLDGVAKSSSLESSFTIFDFIPKLKSDGSSALFAGRLDQFNNDADYKKIIKTLSITNLTPDSRFKDNLNSLGVFSNSQATDFVRVIEEQTVSSNEFILVGGKFKIEQGIVTLGGLIRLNPYGQIDAEFTNNLGPGFAKETIPLDAQVFDIKVLDDNSIIVVGEFDSVTNNTNAKHIVKLNSNGTINTEFLSNIGSSFNGAVKTISYDKANSAIYVGGSFTLFNGTPFGGLVKLNLDGTLASGQFNSNIAQGFDNDINSILQLDDGNLLVGGNFTTFTESSNPKNAFRLAKIYANGSAKDGQLMKIFMSNFKGLNRSTINETRILDGASVRVLTIAQ